MSYTGTLYEGDGLIHTMPLRNESPDSPDRGSEAWSAFTRRFASAWRSFFDSVEESCRKARYRQIEAYLSQSTDLADLERRQRDLERSCHHFFI